MKLAAAIPLTALLLSACTGEGLTTYNKFGARSAIALANDRGRDAGPLENGVGAIVYDPDGCQGWLIDDGLEGYSGRRFDPVSGLPICNNRYAPGTVIGQYRTRTEGIPDFVPGRVVGSGQSAYGATTQQYGAGNAAGYYGQ
ncbi:MAG: hypothetical protein U5N55_06160 [Cypionkella sp.]|nr:hypothetical protein [Cypionkella sp.]